MTSGPEIFFCKKLNCDFIQQGSLVISAQMFLPRTFFGGFAPCQQVGLNIEFNPVEIRNISKVFDLLIEIFTNCDAT
jgi:hypothetical protein